MQNRTLYLCDYILTKLHGGLFFLSMQYCNIKAELILLIFLLPFLPAEFSFRLIISNFLLNEDKSKHTNNP